MNKVGALLVLAALLAPGGCDQSSPSSDLYDREYEQIPTPAPSTWRPRPNPASDDAEAPTVGFSLPATATSLTVGIQFVAVDNVGVTGFALTENATRPSLTSTAWKNSPAVSYTFPASGARTLVAWAKDAAGNVSDGAFDTVTITDTTAPAITAFTLAAPASGTIVTITAFTVTDEFGVTGYLVNTEPAKPLASATGWKSAAEKPTTYTAAASGALTLHAWAKDAAGNVSDSRSAAVTVP